MVGIVDYGMGNLLSVAHAVESCGHNPKLCATGDEVKSCERLILPGVGAFSDCMANLRNSDLLAAVEYFALDLQRPLLGICLGMQAMARRGSEGGECEGLDWFDAEVVRLKPQDTACRVPHVGWNSVDFVRDHPLSRGLSAGSDFYFVHSFHMACRNEQEILAVCEHGLRFTAAIARDNIAAVQFHPEKSQENGLALLCNFLAWSP